MATDLHLELTRALRESRTTQAQLARALGVSRATVSRWFRDGANLELATLERVAAALGHRLEVRLVKD